MIDVVWQLVGIGFIAFAMFGMGLWMGYRLGVNDTEARWSATITKADWVRKHRPDLMPAD